MRGRTCVGCRRVRPKDELVRVVRGAEGRAAVDPSGSAPGRGAYVCPAPECVAAARRRLGKALRAAALDVRGIEEELRALGARRESTRT